MARLLWLPDALAKFGVPHLTVPGWESRGTDPIDPRAIVCHHDAIRSTLPGASIVAMMTKGRPDLAGPLCNLWIDDDYDLTPGSGDPMVYIVAAGKSNNAGAGSWHGVSGNSSTIGIEARNNGLGESWTPRMLDIYERTAAACVDHLSLSASAVCGHKEWAPTRKIDPAGIDMGGFRSDVTALLHTGGGAPTPPSSLTGALPMAVYWQHPDGRLERTWINPATSKLETRWQTTPGGLFGPYAEITTPNLTFQPDSLAGFRGADGNFNWSARKVGGGQANEYAGWYQEPKPGVTPGWMGPTDMDG